MKHTSSFISLCCLLLPTVFPAAAESLYLIPADASGNITKTSDGNYAGQLLFSEGADEHFTLGPVDLPSGKFAIYARSADNGKSTFYDPARWAVTPLPPGYPSPLVIAPDGALMTLLEPGTYSFEFYSRNIEGISMHMLVAKPQSQGMAQYPSKLYLVGSSSDAAVTLPGNPHEGVYYGYVTPPADFKISYEPHISESAFIFGPADGATGDITLTRDESTGIKYATGTDAVFTVAPSALQADAAHIVVNLPDGYIRVHSEIPTGVALPEAEGTAEAYYTITGTRLSEKPAASGIYIRVGGGKAMKIMVR